MQVRGAQFSQAIRAFDEVPMATLKEQPVQSQNQNVHEMIKGVESNTEKYRQALQQLERKEAVEEKQQPVDMSDDEESSDSEQALRAK